MASASTAGNFFVRALEAGDLPVLRASLPEWAPADAQDSTHQFRVLVQRVDGKERLAGIAEYQQILDEGHLLGIAVVPELQRCGLGMQLLQAVLAELHERGCRRCLLEVRRSNTAAQALYARAQFVLDGVRKDYYPPQDAGEMREDALLFSRPL